MIEESQNIEHKESWRDEYLTTIKWLIIASQMAQLGKKSIRIFE